MEVSHSVDSEVPSRSLLFMETVFIWLLGWGLMFGYVDFQSTDMTKHRQKGKKIGSDCFLPANSSGYETVLALVDGFVIGTWQPPVADAKGMNRGRGQAYSHASLA